MLFRRFSPSRLKSCWWHLILYAKEICVRNAGKDVGSALPGSSVLCGTSLQHDRFDLPSAKGSYFLFKHSRISKAAEMQFPSFPAAWGHAVERKTRVTAWKKGRAGNHWASATGPLVYEKEISCFDFCSLPSLGIVPKQSWGMDKQSWHWSLEIKALPQKQSFSSCRFSKQKQGILFSFLKRKVNKIVPGMNLHLTPSFDHSILMGLSAQDNFRPTPMCSQSHPLFYIAVLGLSHFSWCLAGTRGTSFAATCSKMTAPNWASQRYILLHINKKIPRSRLWSSQFSSCITIRLNYSFRYL